MLDIRADPTGTIVRLRCDECHRRRSAIMLFGPADLTGPTADWCRDWLRQACASAGWGQLPSLVEGQYVSIDLCRRCTRKVRRGL